MRFLLVVLVVLVGCGGEDPKPDPDGDGLVGIADECPSLAETVNGYMDDDGCPDSLPAVDSDQDGIPDTQDRCVDEPETQNGYQDTDGCPDTAPPPPADADRDGIPDASDTCPGAAETVNGNSDSDGCPDLSPLFTGQWSGTATMQFTGEAPWFNNTVILTGSVSRDRVIISPVCPLGDGVLTSNVYTDQFRAGWEGSMACAPIAFTNGCQFVVLTYQAAAFGINSNGSALTAAGGGTAAGCGITKQFQMTFAGSRR